MLITILLAILLVVIALYLGVAALCLAMWEGHVEGVRALVAALSWPALLYVLAKQWNWGRD